jgi:alkylation response protein AidB-like acyl-CoA dehydrogenase
MGGEFLVETKKEVFSKEKFSPEHKMVLKSIDEFMEKEVLPEVEKLEKKDFPLLLNLMKKAGNLGFLSGDIPVEYGGVELDYISTAILAERTSRYPSFGVTWGGHTGIGSLPIVIFGTEEQKKKYLPPLAIGNVISAYALTEAEAGSDVMNIKMEAKRVDDKFLLTGEKQFITNAGIAGLFIVFGKVEGEKFTAFIVEKNKKGVKIGEEEEKIGLRGSSTCSVRLEEVEMKDENILYKIGKGHKVAFTVLDLGRFKLGMGCLGMSKEILKEVIGYAKNRKQFGRSIVTFELIQKKLGEMVAKIYAKESMGYRIAGELNDTIEKLNPKEKEYVEEFIKSIKKYAMECSIFKIYTTEGINFVADEGIQIYGGYGYIEDYPIARFYRDARINRIFEGTNEINRLIIGNLLVKEEKLIEKLKAKTSFLTKSSEPLEIGKQVFTLTFNSVISSKHIHNQQVMAILAEQVVEIYAMESSYLRKDRDEFTEVVEIILMEGVRRIIEGGKIIGYSVGDRKLVSAIMELEKNLLPVDLLHLKEKLAQKAVEKNEYPF